MAQSIKWYLDKRFSKSLVHELATIYLATGMARQSNNWKEYIHTMDDILETLSKTSIEQVIHV